MPVIHLLESVTGAGTQRDGMIRYTHVRSGYWVAGLGGEVRYVRTSQ
jgi:hypothetical protein